MTSFLLYLFFFLSGACGLIYELIWLRKLTLIFGNTIYATSSVLIAFMGGLALGSFVLGKIADRSKSPLRLYGLLELGIGVSALALLYLLMPLSNAVYVFVFNRYTENNVLLTLLRLGLSVAMLILPTALMGGTLPVVSKYLIRQSQTLGQKVGLLYSLNTFGGVVGAFCTGFYLMRAYGEQVTVYLAIVTNLLIGVLAVYLVSRERIAFDEIPISNGKSLRAEASAQAVAGRRYPDRTIRVVLGVFGIAGFTSLAYEVVWTRALIFFVSSTTYSFTIILVTFLIGIALGSLLIAKVIDRLRNLMAWLAAAEIGIAIFALLTVPLLRNMHVVQLFLLKFLQVSNWSVVSIFLFVTAFMILILPTLLMGAAFPLANRICVSDMPKLGRGVGSVYMANTVGAIIGSFASAFLLLPALGVSGSLLLLAIVNLLLGAGIIALESDFALRKRVYPAWTAGALLIFSLVTIFFYSGKPFFTGIASFKNTDVLLTKDTSSATISVLERKDEVNIWGRNVRLLNINGHNTAHTTFSDIIIHKMLAHLPMLLHPAAKDALVIGFGFGNTCQSFLQYPIDHLDCVELLDVEKETAAFFPEESRGVFADPRFRFFVNDGRNYVLAKETMYDVISINAVDPKFSPTLYTTEFYRLCRERLSENGLIVAWLPLYGMTLTEVKSLVKSFVDVFPHSSLWYNNPEHLLLLGSMQPQSISLTDLFDKFRSQAIRANLAAIHLDNPFAFLSTFMLGEKALQAFSSDAEAHTDDHPIVEFSRVTTAGMSPEIYNALLEKRESVLDLLTPDGKYSFKNARSELQDTENAMTSMLKGLFLYRITAGNASADTASISTATKWMRESIDLAPENKFNLIYFIDWVQQRDLSSIKALLQTAVKEAPRFDKAYVLLGLESAGRGEFRQAITYYDSALAINDRYVAGYFNRGHAFAQSQDWVSASKDFETVVAIEPGHAFAHSSLAQVYYMQGRYEKAVQHALASARLLPRQANSYFNLGMMYEKTGQIAQAISAFEKGLKIVPQDQRAQEKLRQLRKGK